MRCMHIEGVKHVLRILILGLSSLESADAYQEVLNHKVFFSFSCELGTYTYLYILWFYWIVDTRLIYEQYAWKLETN